jgi:hypothetical protein
MPMRLPILFLAAACLMSVFGVTCRAADPFDKPARLEAFGDDFKSLFDSESFHLKPVIFRNKSFLQTDFNISDAFNRILDYTLGERHKLNQQRLFVLDRERDDLLYSIGAENRPLADQLVFLRRQLQKINEQKMKSEEYLKK